jgi:hypothetical protein
MFHSNIVDFYTSDGRFCTLERKSPVHDIIYDENRGPDAVMKQAREIWKLDDINLKHRLRWIHLPANNVSENHNSNSIHKERRLTQLLYSGCGQR